MSISPRLVHSSNTSTFPLEETEVGDCQLSLSRTPSGSPLPSADIHDMFGPLSNRVKKSLEPFGLQAGASERSEVNGAKAHRSISQAQISLLATTARRFPSGESLGLYNCVWVFRNGSSEMGWPINGVQD